MSLPTDRGETAVLSRTIRRLVFWLVVIVGVLATSWVLFRTDDDPIEVILSAWPTVVFAAFLYVAGMTIYSWSWAALFGDRRRELALGFLVSQPVKYLPGGIAQPIGQIALGVEAVGKATPILVAFPVHVLVNVIAALTIAAPLLFIADLPIWARWFVVLVPLLWVTLDRRWMRSVLDLLGRLHSRFQVSSDLPDQRQVNRAFLLGLAAHGLMFASFGVLTGDAVPGWSAPELTVAFALAWVVGYVVIPAPAGIGAREGMLVVALGGALTAADAVGVTVVHRVMTMAVELAILPVAILLSRAGREPVDRAD